MISIRTKEIISEMNTSILKQRRNVGNSIDLIDDNKKFKAVTKAVDFRFDRESSILDIGNEGYLYRMVMLEEQTNKPNLTGWNTQEIYKNIIKTLRHFSFHSSPIFEIEYKSTSGYAVIQSEEFKSIVNFFDKFDIKVTARASTFNYYIKTYIKDTYDTLLPDNRR